MVQGTTVALGDAGILIRGAPGAGKTTLALALVAAASAGGRFARLVADDVSHLERRGGRLVARAPATIAGLAEVRGHAIVRVPHLPAARLVLVVDLVELPHLERMPEPSRCELLGVSLPRVAAETCNTLAASFTIAFVLPAFQLTAAAGGAQRPGIVGASAPASGAVGGSARGDDR
jgi:HPr kinase/phosphorylase